MQKVRVESLPPNATSQVQPLDAGIIDWVKANYKRRLLLQDFANIDIERKSIYNLDVLSDTSWADMERKARPPEVIVNRSPHCPNSGKLLTNAGRGVNNDAILNIMGNYASDHGVAVSRSGLE